MLAAVNMIFASWFVILIVVVLAFAVQAVVRLARGSWPDGDEGWGFGPLLLVAFLGLGAMMFFYTKQAGQTMPQPSPRTSSTSIRFDGTRTVTVLDGNSPTVIDPRDVTENKPKSPPSKPENPTAEAEPRKSEPPTADDPPAWISEPPHRDGDSYIIAVSSGDVSDPTLRDEALDLKLVAAANRYLDEVLFKQPGTATRLELSPQELREKFVREQFPSPGNAAASDRLYARLELNADFRAEMEARERRVVSHDRLQVVGGIAAGVLVVLAGSSMWLKRPLKPLAA